MVAICKDAGVWSVVDAAHSIGQEVNLNLSEAKPDFWISNCHKWLFAKRGCAVLYVPKRNQHIIKSPIPTPHNYHSPQDEDYKGPQDFARLFEWTGTIDYVPLLSVNAGWCKVIASITILIWDQPWTLDSGLVASTR
ncbi:hypothetical protein AZE42_13837 [Rhizopogon vesiculosus]|uniref:Aminotransferase class V domain-containing protein n=1 Tax=Rhizopogon vesiculosus TaxID=180088 RepID=A0A1J8R758_9AGAM|nr:hypothetical protein AZE42_13837 [Rhizopogon vesiculosus]